MTENCLDSKLQGDKRNDVNGDVRIQTKAQEAELFEQKSSDEGVRELDRIKD